MAFDRDKDGVIRIGGDFDRDSNGAIGGENQPDKPKPGEFMRTMEENQPKEPKPLEMPKPPEDGEVGNIGNVPPDPQVVADDLTKVINKTIGETEFKADDAYSRREYTGETQNLYNGDDSPVYDETSIFPWCKFAFGYSISGEVVKIYPGTIRKHGIGNYALSSETEVTLTGATEWVYAQMSRAGGTVSIKHSATEPASNSTTLKVPLYLFSFVASSYSLERVCNLGDINFDTPIR